VALFSMVVSSPLSAKTLPADTLDRRSRDLSKDTQGPGWHHHRGWLGTGTSGTASRHSTTAESTVIDQPID
jgi:hypothetical protein